MPRPIKRIAIGGMRHETNTFAPTPADYAAFSTLSAEPSPLEGAELLVRLRGANIPVQGALDRLESLGYGCVPLIWAAASPCAHVTQDAFERIIGRLVQMLRDAGPVDGVLLDLHGAMVCTHLEDGEGEILRRVRAVVGPGVPIAVSLDLHANVTRQMFELSDAITVFRTYPHVDSAQTGARAADLLHAMLSTGQRLHKAFTPFDYLTSLPSQCTTVTPARELYRLMEALQARSGVSLDFAMGFAMADIAECGMALVAYGDDAERTQAALAEMATAVREAEADFVTESLDPAQAVHRAMARGRPGAPVILADTQDNPGAGGDGNTTGLLRALIKAHTPDAVLALLIDPRAAALAHTLGTGVREHMSLGASAAQVGGGPVDGEFEVEQLGDGNIHCTGPMFHSWHLQLGPMARLRHVASGVRVVIASRKFQAADQALLRHVGIEPAQQAVLALKSSVHFRNDFEAMASEVLIVKSPGPCTLDPADLPWRRLRAGVRLGPLGPVRAA
jgi:microcystin degradation protein MlrC